MSRQQYQDQAMFPMQNQYGGNSRPPVMPKRTQTSRTNLKNNDVFVFGNTQYHINSQNLPQSIQSERGPPSTSSNIVKRARPNSQRDSYYPQQLSQRSHQTSKQSAPNNERSRSRKGVAGGDGCHGGNALGSKGTGGKKRIQSSHSTSASTLQQQPMNSLAANSASMNPPLRKKSKKKTKQRSPQARSNPADRQQLVSNAQPLQISGSQPLILLNTKDKGRREVIASLEQINDHLDHLMRPLNEIVVSEQAKQQHLGAKALNQKRPQTTRHAKQNLQYTDRLQEDPTRDKVYTQRQQHTALRTKSKQNTYFSNIYQEQQQNFNTINITEEATGMLIPERLSNGCTNLRTLETKELPQSTLRQVEMAADPLESERNHHTIPLQMIHHHYQNVGAHIPHNYPTQVLDETNRHEINMQVLDQVLAVPKSSLSSEHAQLQLSARSMPMNKQQQFPGQKKSSNYPSHGTSVATAPVKQTAEIDQIMDRYRDMCKDLDKDIKQAAQRIKDNLMLDKSEEDQNQKKEVHQKQMQPAANRKKRNLLENSDPFNNDHLGPNPQPPTKLTEINQQPPEKYESNLETSANLASSNYSNKFEFKFQESEYRESNGPGKKSPQMVSGGGKDHALQVNHLQVPADVPPKQIQKEVPIPKQQKLKDSKGYQNLRSEFIKSPSVAEIAQPKQGKQALENQEAFEILNQQEPTNGRTRNGNFPLSQDQDIQIDTNDIRLVEHQRGASKKDKVPRSLLSQISSAVSGIQAVTNTNSTEALDTCKNINNKYNSRFAFSIEESLREGHGGIPDGQMRAERDMDPSVEGKQPLEDSHCGVRQYYKLFEEIGSIQKLKQNNNNNMTDSGFSQVNDNHIKDMQMSHISKITSTDQPELDDIMQNLPQKLLPNNHADLCLTKSQLDPPASKPLTSEEGHIFLKPLNGVDNNGKTYTMGSSECQSLGHNSQGTDTHSQNTADFTKEIFSPGKELLHGGVHSGHALRGRGEPREHRQPPVAITREQAMETPENGNRKVKSKTRGQKDKQKVKIQTFNDENCSKFDKHMEDAIQANIEKSGLIDSLGSRTQDDHVKQDTLGIAPPSSGTDSKQQFMGFDDDLNQHQSPNFEQKGNLKIGRGLQDEVDQACQNIPKSKENQFNIAPNSTLINPQGSQGPTNSSNKLLRQALSLSLGIVCQLSSSLNRTSQQPVPPACNLDQLEDIDSLPSLIDLLAFIQADEDNLMVRNQRILQILQTCTQHLHTAVDDSIYMDGPQNNTTTEESNIAERNVLTGTMVQQEQTSAFANMRQYTVHVQSQVQSPTEVIDSNAQISEAGESGLIGAKKWAEDSEIIKGGVDLQHGGHGQGVRMPDIRIEVSRGSIVNDDQPSSIREQVPLNLNNQSQSAVTDVDHFFRDSDQSQVVVQAQADISEFRHVNHVSSPIEHPGLYQEDDDSGMHPDETDPETSQADPRKIRQFQAVSESKCSSNGGGPGFGAMLEESPQLKSLNRLNIQTLEQRFPGRPPNVIPYGTMHNSAVSEVQIVETFRNTCKDREFDSLEQTHGRNQGQNLQHRTPQAYLNGINQTLEQVTEEDTLAANFTENREYEHAVDLISGINSQYPNQHKKNQSNLIKPLELSKISAVQDDKQSYSKNASVLCFAEEAVNMQDHQFFQNKQNQGGGDRFTAANAMALEKKKFQTVEVDKEQSNECYVDNKEPEQLLTLRNQEIFQFSQEEQNMRDSNLFSQNHDRSFSNNIEVNPYYGGQSREDSSFQFQQAEDNSGSQNPYNDKVGNPSPPDDKLFVQYKVNCKQMLENLTGDSQEDENEQNGEDEDDESMAQNNENGKIFDEKLPGKSKKNKNTTCRLSQSDLMFSKQIMSSVRQKKQQQFIKQQAGVPDAHLGSKDDNIHILEEQYCDQQSFSSQFKEGISQTESHSHSQSQSQSHSHLNSIQSAIRKIDNDGKRPNQNGYDYHAQIFAWESQNRQNNCKILQYERIESEKEDTNVMASSSGQATQQFHQYHPNSTSLESKPQGPLSPSCSSPKHESGEVQLKEIKGNTLQMDVNKIKNQLRQKEHQMHFQFQTDDARKKQIQNNGREIRIEHRAPDSLIQTLGANEYFQQTQQQNMQDNAMGTQKIVNNNDGKSGHMMIQEFHQQQQQPPPQNPNQHNQNRKQINLVRVAEISTGPQQHQISNSGIGGEEETNDELSQSCASVSQQQIEQLLFGNNSAGLPGLCNKNSTHSDAVAETTKFQNILNVGGATVKISKIRHETNNQAREESVAQQMQNRVSDGQKDNRLLHINQQMSQKEKDKYEHKVVKDEAKNVIKGLIETQNEDQQHHEDVLRDIDMEPTADKRQTLESNQLLVNTHPSEMTNSNSNSVLRNRAPSYNSIQQRRLKIIQEPSQLSSMQNDSIVVDTVPQVHGGPISNLSSARQDFMPASQTLDGTQGKEGLMQKGGNPYGNNPLRTNHQMTADNTNRADQKRVIEAYESDDDSGIGHAQANPQRMPTVQDLPEEDNPIPFVFKDIESEYEDRIMPYSEKMRSGKRAKSKIN